MDSRFELTHDGVRLAGRDYGGDGPPVLLLHGLAGHAEEWAQTASWLIGRCRVVAPDARGHGHGEREPADVSRSALVADAAHVIEALGLERVVAVGQSLGGLTALCLAARRPDLVRGLVVADATPDGGREVAELVSRAIGTALREWPLPFGSVAEAERFFGERFGGAAAGRAWAGGMKERADGWWPRFDIDVMVRMMREAAAQPAWEEWEAVACPALLVRAGDGLVDPETAHEMIARLPGARLAELAGASHELHLDRPEQWRAALSAFLDALDHDLPARPPREA